MVLASALLALGRYDEVLSEMRVALEQDPDSPEGLLLRGEALFRKGDSRRAREILKRVHRLDPRSRAGALLAELDRALEHPSIGGPEETTGTKQYPHTGADDPASTTGEVSPTDADEVESTRAFQPGDDRAQAEFTGETDAPPPVARPRRPRAPSVDGGDVQVDPELIAEASRLHERAAPPRRYDSDPPRSPPRGAPSRWGGSAGSAGRGAEGPLEDPSEPSVPSRGYAPSRLDPSEPSMPSRGYAPSQLDPSDPSVRAAPPPRDEDRGRGARPTRALPAPSQLDPQDSMAAPVQPLVRRAPLPPPSGGRKPEPTFALAERDLLNVRPSPVGTPAALELSERDLEIESAPPVAATMAVGGEEMRARALADIRAAERAAPARVPRKPRHELEGEPDSFVAQAARQLSTASPGRPQYAPEPRAPAVYPAASPTPYAEPSSVAEESAPRESERGLSVLDDSSVQQAKGRGSGSVKWQDAGQVEALPRNDRRGGRRAGARGGVGGGEGSGLAGALDRVRAAFGELVARAGAVGGRKRARPRTEALGVTGRPVSPLVLVLSALGVVAIAVAAGLVVRHLRMSQRQARLSAEAAQAMMLQTYRGYATALATYRALAKQGGGAEKARAARAAAALAFEFDEGLDDARRLVAALPKDARREAMEARIYLALAQDDGAAAAREAKALAAQKGGGAGREAAYLLARALLLEDDAAGAADQLRESIRIGPTPLALTWLGILEAGRGRYDEGVQALEQALALAPGHPGATTERLRLLAASGKLGRDKNVEAELAGLVARWQAEAGQGAARAQVAWGALTLAEVRMALGEEASAIQALATARQARPARDARFTAALIRALLKAGDPGAAREEVAIAEKTWPGPGQPAVWAAWIALAEGKPVEALAALDRAGPAAARADALAARGQAKLIQGDVEGAAKHLDDALAVMPEDVLATSLRAQIDLETGDARQAVRRLEPFANRMGDPELAVTLGAALLAAGDRDRARTVLEKAARGARGALAHIELGRLAAGEGRFDDARREFEAAMAGPARAGVRARLEAALLLHDLGNAGGARESIDALAKDAPEDSDVLLVVARLHGVTGDLAGAEKRLDEAGKKTGAAPWRLRRERGRILLLRDDAQAAARELAEAIKLRPDDPELRVLHLRALAAAASPEAMNKALLEVVKRFGGTPEASLATGLFELAIGRGPPAINAFAAAVRDLEARRAAPRVLAEARALLGRAYLENGDLLQARAQLLQAAKLDPSSPEPHYWLAMLAVDQKQLPTARQELQRALAIRPTYPDALYDLGEVARKQRDRRAAAEAFRKYLDVAPRGSYAAEARGFLR